MRVFEPGFRLVERDVHAEDGLALLNRHHPARGEAAAVPDPLHLVEHGPAGIPRPHEVGPQRMRLPALHGVTGRTQRLREHLPAEQAHAFAGFVAAAVEVLLDGLELENVQQPLRAGPARRPAVH
jgi:hypothetical protein